MYYEALHEKDEKEIRAVSLAAKRVSHYMLETLNLKKKLQFIPVQEFHRSSEALAHLVDHISHEMASSFIPGRTKNGPHIQGTKTIPRMHLKMKCVIPVSLSYRHHVMQRDGMTSLLNRLGRWVPTNMKPVKMLFAY